MKKILIFLFAFQAIVLLVSCDKVERPFVIVTELDTSLFDGGDFIDYVPPTFEQNTNTERNVLLEDYTGHQCIFCPAAAAEALLIETNNPGRVFVATIHASPNPSGTSSFQAVQSSGEKYRRDFTTPEGKEIASHLANVHGGGVGNPTGTINREKSSNGEIFVAASEWAGRTADALSTDLQVNIQAKSSYFPSTRGTYIHAEVEFLTPMSGEFAIVVYALDNQIIDWQKKPGQNGDVEFYNHHNVHIGNVFAGESFGRTLINGDVSSGQKIEQAFSYQLPVGLPKEDMHFLIFVVDKGTEEVFQVIKHEI